MIRTVLFIVIVIAVASCHVNDSSEIRVTAVKRGTFMEELTEQGTLAAVNSILIGAPTISYRYGSLKIAKIVDDGAEVEMGDTIIIFDPSEIRRAIIQAEQQLQIANAEYQKMISAQRSEIEDLEADFELAMISQEIAKINYETSAYEPEATRKDIQLRLETATISMNRVSEQIANRKLIHKEDLVQKSLGIRQVTSVLEDATKSLDNLFVVSPAMGVAIKKDNYSTGQKWAVGDQPYSGSTLIELPDLSAMRATVKINEVDVAKILPGQKVEIRPDAYSDSIFPSQVESVAYLAQNKDYKSKIKVFPTQISISGQSNRLLPGLTVSCRIIVNEVNDVLIVPLEAVYSDHGEQYVYVKNGTSFIKTTIKAGAVNSNFAMISEGLDEGDMVALSNPFADKQEVNEKSASSEEKVGSTKL
jgi:HlyD family secretion protein